MLYVLVGYPVLLLLLARIRPHPVARKPYWPSISMILATYNGAAFLRDKLLSIQALDYPHSLLSLIVVDDGSSDETPQIVEACAPEAQYIRLARSGKSAALNRGIAVATGDVLVFTDVRQVLAPDSLRLLMENLADPDVAVVSAELQIKTGTTQAEADTGAYWRYEKFIRNNLSALDSIFGATGAYYAVRRNLALPIPPEILNDDMYLPMRAFFDGFRLVVDERAQMFDYPTGLSAEFGRKVRTLAGNYQLLRHYPQLLSFHNRLLGHYLSYKLGRLFLPFALLLAVVSSLFLGKTVAVFSCLFQALSYALVLADPYLPAKSALKRISSPLRSFLVLMFATACAVSVWFVPPHRLWQPTKVSTRDEVSAS